MNVDAVIVAAGQGARFGASLPKQLVTLVGAPLWTWSYRTLSTHPGVRQCVLVIPPDATDRFSEAGDALLVAGAATRTESVQNGLVELQASATPPDAVLIHDAARPGLDASIITALIDALATAPAAAPAIAVVDALKRETGDGLATVDRDQLYRVQTPQAFHFPLITQALLADAAAPSAGLVDDLAAVEALGARVSLVAGAPENDKVTYPEDAARLETLMQKRLSDQGPPLPAVRMGKGFDVHAFEPGPHVTLCGVDIPYTARLKGHSDADVAWHALTDAILGAIALGDIGDHFPPNDPQWRGAPSHIFLEAAAGLARNAGYQLTNCDITIICEAPKIKPHREAMRTRTAELLGLPLSAISVKATTTEGLGFTGRGEGIAAEAIAVLTAITPASNGA